MDLKALTKRILKPSAFGRLVYPLVQVCYRACAIPACRRLLQREGWGALARAHTVLKGTGVSYFFDYGTFLGLIRDGGFIPNDDDIDLSILPGSAEPQCLLRAFIETGYGYVHGFRMDGVLYEFTVRDPSGLTLDVFFPARVSDKPGWMVGYDTFWEPTRKYPSETANTVVETLYRVPNALRTVSYRGVEVFVPCDAETLLREEYGPNWRVPDPTFVAREVMSCRESPTFAYRQTLEEALKEEP